jgi:hypothetical protein
MTADWGRSGASEATLAELSMVEIVNPVILRWLRAALEGRRPRCRSSTLRGPLRSHLRVTGLGGLRGREAEASEKRPARIAVRDHAVAHLQLADVVVQIEVEMAVEVGDLIAERGELLLQRDAL